jgi:hypothetical protein
VLAAQDLLGDNASPVSLDLHSVEHNAEECVQLGSFRKHRITRVSLATLQLVLAAQDLLGTNVSPVKVDLV